MTNFEYLYVKVAYLWKYDIFNKIQIKLLIKKLLQIKSSKHTITLPYMKWYYVRPYLWHGIESFYWQLYYSSLWTMDLIKDALDRRSNTCFYQRVYLLTMKLFETFSNLERFGHVQYYQHSNLRTIDEQLLGFRVRIFNQTVY